MLNHQPIFFQILIIASLLTLISSSYISALQYSPPFRNGKYPNKTGRIYVRYKQFQVDLNLVRINFQESLSVIPKGITLGVRTMQNSQQDCLFIDFGFKVNTFFLTSFEMSGFIGKIYPMFFTKIVIDYVVSATQYVFTYSLMQNYTVLKTSNVNNIFVAWQYTCLYNQSKSNIYFSYAIVHLIGNFSYGQFRCAITDQYISTWNKKVEAKFTNAVSVNQIFLSLIIVNSNQFIANYPNYRITQITDTTYKNYQVKWWIDRPYFQQWIGLRQFQGYTNRFNFQLKYSPQFIDQNYSTLQRQLNAQRQFVVISNYSFPITLKFTIFSYHRSNCDNQPTHSYIIEANQLCYQSCLSNTTSLFPKRCTYCIDIFDYCQNCIYIEASFTLRCTGCRNDSNNYLYGDRCHNCADNQYYHTATNSCLLCSLNNCSRCSIDSISCQKCLDYTNSEMINGECVQCNSSSYSNFETKVCQLCSSALVYCSECTDIGSGFECKKCNENYELDGVHECIPCDSNQYYNLPDRSCHKCSAHCSSCNSNTECQACDDVDGYHVQLVGAQCILTLINQEQNQRQVPEQEQEQLTNNKNQSYCILSTYNNQSKQCHPYQQLVIVISTITLVSSIPTINLAINSFVNLFGLLDDLSYFSYHNRNYLNNVKIFLGQMRNYTLFRFFPIDLSTFLNKFMPHYSNNILLYDFNKTPSKFKQIDGDIYFIKNTQTIWLRTIPFSVLVFCLLSFVHWISNKFIKNNLFQRYNYFGMLIVDIFSGNIQYLTFRCTQQLYQIIPYDNISYTNLVVSYITLFLVIIYIIGNVTIFKSVYPKLESSYVIEQLFGSYWVARLVLLNLIKMLTGFIQAYFYYNHQLQSLLILLMYTLKMLVFATTIKRINNSGQYILELIVSCFLCSLTGCFFIENIFLRDNYVIDYQSVFGKIETSIIVISVILQLISTLINYIKSVIQSLKIFIHYKDGTRINNEQKNNIKIKQFHIRQINYKNKYQQQAIQQNRQKRKGFLLNDFNGQNILESEQQDDPHVEQQSQRKHKQR